ncbi:MAG TPA: PepSY domain-containing protein [Rubrivivax sp.]|nr:PepSY domain-containing protein [Rubrivivax sp.]
MQALHTPARRLLLAACAGTALTLGIAQAQPAQPASAAAQATSPAATTQATPPAAPQLTIRDIYDRMEAAGYRDMREIELDNGRYEVKARNAQGERVKLYVNAGTGAVERERRDR